MTTIRTTKIEPIDSLSAQRAALEANSLDIFKEQVMMPIAAFWQPHVHRFPTQGEGDPAILAGQAMGFYSPSEDCAAGLAAIQAFEEANTWPMCINAIEQGFAALNPEVHGIAMEPVQFTLLLGSLRILRMDYGAYTGFQQPGMALVMGWPNPIGTPRLPVASAHELNHIVRFQYEPWTMATTVGQYMVAEGLAESFGLEIVGDRSLVGPYSAALSLEQLAAMKPRFKEGLNVSGFDVIRGYIFGDWSAEQFQHAKLGIPDYAGYTIGFEVVQAFMQRTGTSAAAATFLPWQQIVEESRYFE